MQGVQGVQGAPGPTAVSADAGNVAIIGSDAKIYVPTPPAGSTGTEEVAIQSSLPALATLELWVDPAASVGPSTFSHSSLLNLSNDDHTQYFNKQRADADYLRRDGTVAMTGVLTLAPSAPTLDNHAARLQDVRAIEGRRVDGGNGLTGGGALTTSQTLHVGAGTGITVTQDFVNVDTTVIAARADVVLKTMFTVSTQAASGAGTAAGHVWIQY